MFLLFSFSIVFLCLLGLEILVFLKAFDNLVRLPLCPHEVILLPGFKVAHRPPEALLECRPHKNRVVAAPDVVLIGSKGRDWERCVTVVRFVHLHEEGPVMPLLQIEVTFLVLGVR